MVAIYYEIQEDPFTNDPDEWGKDTLFVVIGVKGEGTNIPLTSSGSALVGEVTDTNGNVVDKYEEYKYSMDSTNYYGVAIAVTHKNTLIPSRFKFANFGGYAQAFYGLIEDVIPFL